jgi:hypothetical protein
MLKNAKNVKKLGCTDDNKRAVMCMQRGISGLYRPPRPVTGIALLYGDGVCFL